MDFAMHFLYMTIAILREKVFIKKKMLCISDDDDGADGDADEC